MSFQIESADALVDYIMDFTGSSNVNEIRQCIYLAEMKMRNIELPALRNNPSDPGAIRLADDQGRVDIPTDMNKPILFWQQGAYEPYNGQARSSYMGPWIVYDRIGDRDIISLSLLQQFFLWPVNLPQVVRGKFGEVGDKYQLTPKVAEGTRVVLYYYRAWDLLFSPYTDVNWDMQPWDSQAWDITVEPYNIVQMNPVLATFPEGYVYGTLAVYYTKRHQADDANYYQGLFEDSWKRVTDQNDLGKWSGGTTRMTSIFQPRRGLGVQVK